MACWPHRALAGCAQPTTGASHARWRAVAQPTAGITSNYYLNNRRHMQNTALGLSMCTLSVPSLPSLRPFLSSSFVCSSAEGRDHPSAGRTGMDWIEYAKCHAHGPFLRAISRCVSPSAGHPGPCIELYRQEAASPERPDQVIQRANKPTPFRSANKSAACTKWAAGLRAFLAMVQPSSNVRALWVRCRMKVMSSWL